MTNQGWTVRPGPVPALLWPDDENPDMPFSLTEGDLAEMLPDALDRQVAAAFAALRDALARDAQVREIVDATDAAVRQSDGRSNVVLYGEGMCEVVALYPPAPSPGVRVDSEEQK